MNGKKGSSVLGILSLILSIIGCTALIGLILAIVDLKKDDGKNKLLSKISLGICGLWLLIGIASGIGNRKNPDTNNTAESSTTVITDETSEEIAIEETTTSSNESTTIELIAGELGEYGNIVVLGADTDFPDTNYCYVVPVGTYTVTNIGDYRTQVDVNRNELATDVDSDGNEYEYWADCTPYLIEVGATQEISIEEGYFIEIEEPTHLLLEPIGTTTPQTMVLPTSEIGSDDTAIMSLDDYMDYLDATLNDSFGENYSIEIDDNFITISVWQDGIAQGALLASTGDSSCIDAWNTMVDGMVSMADGINDSLQYVDADDLHVYINVLNDENPENTLLSIMDGTVIYDAVT